MNRDWVPLGVGRNGLGGHIMVRRQITPHNPIRDMAAAQLPPAVSAAR
jgi:hypothetical protein